MKAFLKRNYLVLSAFALPILFIVAVALSVYVPSLFVKTEYDFIYATCINGGSYYGSGCDDYMQQRYTIEGEQLTLNDVSPTLNTAPTYPSTRQNLQTRLFRHDSSTNLSREITSEDAVAYRLGDLLTSPDGATVTWVDSSSTDTFFVFSARSSPAYYLSRGNSKKKLNIIYQARDYYGDNFHFIGWVLLEAN